MPGTTNFVHRFPFVCVSIALVTHRQPLVAVVLNPILGELFVAKRYAVDVAPCPVAWAAELIVSLQEPDICGSSQEMVDPKQ